ncbi:MAG: universal stress protein [Thaumarchaeota archaeon]|nr:universal stress protein [Nitrososphaerota archaeon]
MTQSVHMFTKILVAIDGSQSSMSAVKYGATLANDYKASIVIVNVVDLSSIFKILPVKTKKQLIRLGVQESHRILDIAKNMTNNINVKTEVIESSMSAGNAIIDYSKRRGIDLIVIGAGKKSRIEKTLLGTVATKIVSNAACPVLVVR